MKKIGHKIFNIRFKKCRKSFIRRLTFIEILGKLPAIRINELSSTKPTFLMMDHWKYLQKKCHKYDNDTENHTRDRKPNNQFEFYSNIEDLRFACNNFHNGYILDEDLKNLSKGTEYDFSLLDIN